MKLLALLIVVNHCMSTLQSDGLNGPLKPEIWDDGDAVAAWTSTNLAAVLFPTASTMDKVKPDKILSHLPVLYFHL